MQHNGPYRERSGAIVDVNGRIEIAAYEQRGEQFRGDKPHLVDDAIICPLFIPRKYGFMFLRWMEEGKVDCFCLTSTGPKMYARMDRHWVSDYTQIEQMFDSNAKSKLAKSDWVAVGFSDPEKHAEARQLFGSLELDMKLEKPPVQWGNDYVA